MARRFERKNKRAGDPPYATRSRGDSTAGRCLNEMWKRRGLVRLAEGFLLGRGEGDRAIRWRHQLADGVFVLIATLAEPLFQVLAGGRSQLREKESGTAQVTGPDHVGVAVERDVGARKHAAESDVGIHGH